MDPRVIGFRVLYLCCFCVIDKHGYEAFLVGVSILTWEEVVKIEFLSIRPGIEEKLSKYGHC